MGAETPYLKFHFTGVQIMIKSGGIPCLVLVETGGVGSIARIYKGLTRFFGLVDTSLFW
jgi:hypothetical protein